MAFRGSIEKGTTLQRPTSPDEGFIYYNTTSKAFEIYDGTQWNQLAFGNVNAMLDTFDTPAGAYSVRKLKSNYTGPCMQVRRHSDNATQDIPFDENGELDTASIETFCSGTSGEVSIWYDQSGNNKDAENFSNNNQPWIYENGAVVRDINGVPALRFDDTTSTYLTITNQTMGGDDACISMVCSFAKTKEHYVYGGGYSTDNSFLVFANGVTRFGTMSGTLSSLGTNYLNYPKGPTGYAFQYTHSSGAGVVWGGNESNNSGGSLSVVNSLTADHHIGWAIPRNKAGAHYDGKIQEFIMWNDTKNDGRIADLFENQREYYSLYVSLSSTGYGANTNEVYVPANDQGNQYVAKVRTASNFLVNKPNLSTSYLLVAGGGGGGAGHTGSSLGGGGGGAGGLVNSSASFAQGAYAATPGAGGAGFDGPSSVTSATSPTENPSETGAQGGNTILHLASSLGGGGGGTRNSHEQGKDGGSGGGAAGNNDRLGGAGTAGQGNRGGNDGTSEWAACGGGGAGAPGGDANGASTARTSTNGGIGLQYSIDGSNKYYAGGGGGGGHNGGAEAYGLGGSGGGGRGGEVSVDQGQPGTDGLGGGGGGGPAYSGNTQGDSNGGDGGDGVIVIRWTGSKN